MPRRQYIRSYDSTEVQGEGSYVKIRDRSWKDAKELEAKAAGLSGRERTEVVFESVSERIVEWNWVDDNEKPLPLPSEDPTVRERLYEKEIEFLLLASAGKAEQDSRKSS